MDTKQHHDEVMRVLLELSEKKYPANGQHDIDWKKAEAFLTATKLQDEAKYEFARAVIDNTRYITYNTLIRYARRCFMEFSKDMDGAPYYIIVDMDRIASEHLVLSQMLDLIAKTNFQGFISIASSEILEEVNEPVNIAYVDDVIYSGVHAAGYFDELTYPRSGYVRGRTQDMNLAKINCYPIVPFQSSGGAHEDFKFNSLQSYYMERIHSMEEIVGKDADLTEFYTGNDISCYPVYLDTRVGDSFSSYRSIYLDGLLPDGTTMGSLLVKNPSKYIAPDYSQKAFVLL